MKVISKLLMCALVLSVFAGCSKDDENLPIKDIAGTYTGKITAGETEIPNVPITIRHTSGDKISLSVPGIIFGIEDIVAECTATSTKDSYSISGSVFLEKIKIIGSVEGAGVEGEAAMEIDSVTVTVKDSKIDKSGTAVINMDAAVLHPVTNVVVMPLMSIKFEGKKQ